MTYRSNKAPVIIWLRKLVRDIKMSKRLKKPFKKKKYSPL